MATRKRKSSTGNRKAASNRQQKQSSMEGNELHELFLDDLADIYNAENQLVKALPKMAKAAQSEELREAFETHLEETRGQIARIENVVRVLGESLKRKKCKGMEGLLEEGKEMMEEKADSPALDAALIAAAQKVEHYEIATYGTLCTWAELMGHREALNLLKQNLSEEEATDEKLTEIAESVANIQADRD
jgi:ferritin-like metal-binding protein YciE